MDDTIGTRISKRALQHLGVPFRLHGRSAVGGFDCVGLAADALSHVGFDAPMPSDYSLRGEFSLQIFAFFDHSSFAAVALLEAGDFVAVQAAPRQMHLMIACDQGFVHAHAGLRRVVLTPAPSPWPIIGQWRAFFE